MEAKKTPIPAREKKLYGLLVEFEHPQHILAAAEKTKRDGYRYWDVFTPFPVHGMDHAMGIKRTILPWFVFIAGATGTTVAIGLQWFTNAWDYDFLISGKPIFSLPANIPVAFELTVLFAALTAFIGMMVLNWLPEFYHPAFQSEKFRRVTSDRFFLLVEARDPHFDLKETTKFFEVLKPVSIETLED